MIGFHIVNYIISFACTEYERLNLDDRNVFVVKALRNFGLNLRRPLGYSFSVVVVLTVVWSQQNCSKVGSSPSTDAVTTHDANGSSYGGTCTHWQCTSVENGPSGAQLEVIVCGQRADIFSPPYSGSVIDLTLNPVEEVSNPDGSGTFTGSTFSLEAGPLPQSKSPFDGKIFLIQNGTTTYQATCGYLD
jgi:hypothetical protein